MVCRIHSDRASTATASPDKVPSSAVGYALASVVPLPARSRADISRPIGAIVRAAPAASAVAGIFSVVRTVPLPRAFAAASCNYGVER